DGIRVDLVTGVQTCALPIWYLSSYQLRYRYTCQSHVYRYLNWYEDRYPRDSTRPNQARAYIAPLVLRRSDRLSESDEVAAGILRSEERSVGREEWGGLGA